MTAAARMIRLVMLAALAGAWATSSSQAGVTESHWISDNEDCDFVNPINWSGPVPDETVTAIFDLEPTLEIGPFVCFGFDEASHRVIVRAGDPEFYMFGFPKGGGQISLAYELFGDSAAAPSLVVGEAAGQDVSLRIVDGHVTTGSTVLGLAAGSSGLLELDTVFSALDVSLTCANRLFVGDGGSGAVEAEDKTTISCGTAQLGIQPGSYGQITLNNPDVSLSVGALLLVGGAGEGYLLAGLTDGPVSVTCGSAVVGGAAASVGLVELGGQSTWSSSGTLTVANAGQGTVVISGDSDLETASAVIGQQFGSLGAVTVRDLGSTWAINGALDIGFLGEGSLTIENNGAVFALDTFVTLGTLTNLFDENGGVGSATVEGPASIWFIDGDLYVGFLAVGTLTVADGGTVVSQSITVNPASTLRVVNGGTLAPGPVVEGLLEGDGILQTPSVSSSGTIRAGNPVGTLTIDGDLFGSAGLEIEIAGADPGQFDVLAVTGSAALGGVTVAFQEGYTPQSGDTFEIITAASLVGNLDPVLPALPEPLLWVVHLEAGSLVLVISKPGDIDGDGVVSVTDLLALLSAWGPCPPDPEPCPADFNGVGAVDVTDLLTLLGNFDT